MSESMPRDASSRPVLTVMLLIAAMVLPAAGNVVCIGPDGHAAIEPAHPDRDCEEVEGRNLPSDGPSVAAASGDCIDLPLAAIEWMTPPEQERLQFHTIAPDLLSPIYLIDLDSVSSPRPSHLSRWPDQDGVPEFVLSLRSTVLLL